MTIALWDHTLATSPGATSTSTASHAYAANTLYIAFVTQMRTDSVEPSEPTVSGMGATWTEVTTPNGYWDSSVPSLRKTRVFRARPSSGGTGTVTVSYASQPADIDICIVSKDDADTVVQLKDVGFSPTGAGALFEPLTMTTPGSTDNRFIAFVAQNVEAAASARLELAADSGGDANWTTLSALGTAAAPTATYIAGYLNANPTTDLTPGFRQSSGQTAAAYMVVLELNKTAAAPPTLTGERIGGVVYETGGGAPPPPEVPSLLVGATVDTRNGQSYAQATAQFNTDLSNAYGSSVSIEVGRRFFGSLPASFDSVNQFVQDKNVRSRIISWKAEPTLAENQTFMATIPNDGFITWCITHHEPENDGGSHTSAWFRGMLDNLHGAWVNLGRPAHLRPSLCLMTWLERDGNAGTSSADWFPTSDKIADFTLWLDPYDPNSNETLQQQAGATLDLWVAAGGSPTKWGITETGSHRTGSNLANWIHESVAWCRSNGAVGYCYFHSAVGNDGPWWLDDVAGRAALAAEIAA